MLTWMAEKVTRLVALLVGLTVFRWVWSMMVSNTRGEVGFGGVVFLLVAGACGVGAYLAFSSFADPEEVSGLRWLTACVGGVTLVLLGFLLPASSDDKGAQQQSTQQQEAQYQGREPVDEAKANAAMYARQAAWAQTLRESDAHHAPPGTPPPYLEVRDEGNVVELRNTTSGPLHVALARVRQAPGHKDGWKACSMYTIDPLRQERTYYFTLEPGASARYQLYDCGQDFESAPIEFRVGRYIGDTAFWSDSAFDAVKGRSYALGN